MDPGFRPGDVLLLVGVANFPVCHTPASDRIPLYG
jgi:hypothetical protein